MIGNAATLHQVGTSLDEQRQEETLNRTFLALCDPVRRAILERLDEGPALVKELAEPFDISLQAVSRHIQVLVRAGLVGQERSGRINRCSLLAEPILTAAVWINRYSKYWQGQFDLLAVALSDIERERASPRPAGRRRSRTRRKTSSRPES